MDYLKFIKSFNSLLLATSYEDTPHCSYCTYIIKDNSFYIFISDIAKHSQNLKNNPKASILFINDENKSNNIFARDRVTIDTNSCIIVKNSEKYNEIIALYKTKFDTNMVDTLSVLDFNLYQLKPIKMNTYFGFGMAKEITNILLEDIGEENGI